MRLLVAGWIAWLAATASSWGQTPAAPVAPEGGLPREASPSLAIDEEAASRLITNLVRELLPHTYEDNRDWGGTKRVWDGLHIRTKGLQIKTKRRWKEVNHGTWKMYRVRLIDPAEQFRLTVENVRPQENGSVAFVLHADARLALLGRVAEWRRDVQLVSLSAEGVARVRLTVQCEMAMRLDPRKLPPDLVLLPQVTAARLHLSDFRIDRISKIDGSLAEEIGRNMRRALEDKLEEDQDKLAGKFNRQIAKNQDKLRLSLHDALASKWGRWIDPDALKPTTP